MENLQKCLERKIRDVYFKYGGWNTSSVIVSEDKVEIYIDTEKPYFGGKFFDMIDDLAKEIEEPLKNAGFKTKVKREFLFGFLHWEFTK